MNPVENEAVIAALLRRSVGTVRLLDVSDQLPGARAAPPTLHWLPPQSLRHAFWLTDCGDTARL